MPDSNDEIREGEREMLIATGDDIKPRPQDMPSEPEHDNIGMGMLVVGCSAAAFSVMSMFVQLIKRGGIPSMQIVFMNSVMRCCLAIPQMWAALAAKWPFTSNEVIGLVAINALAGALGHTVQP